MQLLQTILGAAQAPAPGTTAGAQGELVGSLLSGLAGRGDDSAGIDAGDLLNAGLEFMQSKQQGQTDLEAPVDALVSTSRMGNSPHRAMSSKLVTNTMFQAIGQLAGK